MSFPRHPEIYPSDGGASLRADASTHRLDEFPAGYSLAGCSPALPASASPTGHHFALKSNCRSSTFQRTAHSVLTVCLSPGGQSNSVRDVEHLLFVRKAQELGFTLAEIRELLVVQDERTEACTHVRELILESGVKRSLPAGTQWREGRDFGEDTGGETVKIWRLTESECRTILGPCKLSRKQE